MEAPGIRSGTYRPSIGLQRRMSAAGRGVQMPAEVKSHFRELRESLRTGRPDEVKRAQQNLATSLSSSLRGQGVPEPDIQSVLGSIGQLKTRGQRDSASAVDTERAPIASPSANRHLGAYQQAIAPPQTRGFLMDALA
ncbi:MAG: hypothetical protein VKP72_01025 [bacterium]|nr:hypothetical protein [bacterium]